MFRVWYSNPDHARYYIDNTQLLDEERNGKLICSKLYESDANNSKNFHKVPTHIKKILYLDAPDIIIEKNDKPILSIEISTEAGTGHNAFQRFSRISAAIENNVPVLYIYPEAVYVYRRTRSGWDRINPLIFQALEKAMRIYNIPALLYYFPSNLRSGNTNFPRNTKGLLYDNNYPTCPFINNEIQHMFDVINLLVRKANNGEEMTNLLGEALIHSKRDDMLREFYNKTNGNTAELSPVTATEIIPTSVLLDYLSNYSGSSYSFDGILPSRLNTLVYKVNADFRGDPYPGALAGLDYIMCRNGKSFEDRNLNLVLAWGNFNYDAHNNKITITGDANKSINEFVNAVQSTYSGRKILLNKNYSELKGYEIPRYFMQVRFGSSFTKVKHIRVYSYFCDAILFHDGALWREG